MQTAEQIEKYHVERETDEEEGSWQEEFEPARFNIASQAALKRYS